MKTSNYRAAITALFLSLMIFGTERASAGDKTTDKDVPKTGAKAKSGTKKAPEDKAKKPMKIVMERQEPSTPTVSEVFSEKKILMPAGDGEHFILYSEKGKYQGTAHIKPTPEETMRQTRELAQAVLENANGQSEFESGNGSLPYCTVILKKEDMQYEVHVQLSVIRRFTPTSLTIKITPVNQAAANVTEPIILTTELTGTVDSASMPDLPPFIRNDGNQSEDYLKTDATWQDMFRMALFDCTALMKDTGKEGPAEKRK